MDIGQFVKTRRLELKFSQRQVALSSGLSNATISRIESGAVIPDAATLSRVAKALKLNPSLLFRICGYISEPAVAGSQERSLPQSRPKISGAPRGFGARLRELRESAGYSPEEFCEAMGCSVEEAAAWEAGTKAPGSGAMQSLADFFGVTLSYLAGKSDEKYAGLRQRSVASKGQPVLRETEAQDIKEVLRELSKAVENAQRVLEMYSEDEDR